MSSEFDAFVRPPYSILFVGDPDAETPEPRSLRPGLVAATEGCIVVGTQVDFDGATRVRLLVDEIDPQDRPPLLVFDGVLRLASGQLVIQSAELETYFERSIADRDVRARVWVNHRIAPDDIVIALARPSQHWTSHLD